MIFVLKMMNFTFKKTLPKLHNTIVVAPLEAVSRRQLLLHHVPWPETASRDSVVLYRLELFDETGQEAAGTPIDINTYWLSHPGAHQDYSALAASEHTAGGEHAATVSLTATPVPGGAPPFGRELEVEYALTFNEPRTDAGVRMLARGGQQDSCGGREE